MRRRIKKILKGLTIRKYVNVTVQQIAPSGLLKDKNIVVTGGGRGLGLAIVKKCLAEGAKVLITGRDEQRLMDISNELGENCFWYAYDMRNIKDISMLISKSSEKLGGRIDCLVSNAGISFHEGNFRRVTLDGWDAQMDVNLKANFFLVQEMIKYWENSKKEGNIVVITSERAKRADDIPYGLTKVASNSFIKCIASKVIGEGIRINGVAPGVTASDMTGYKSDGNLYSENQPRERVFLPEEVAEVVLFLLCDASQCISGEIITCDQGRYISHW